MLDEAEEVTSEKKKEEKDFHRKEMLQMLSEITNLLKKNAEENKETIDFIEKLNVDTLQKVIEEIKNIKWEPKIDVAQPKIEVKVPEIKVPDIKVPKVEVPQTKVDVKSVDINKPTWISGLFDLKTVSNKITELKDELKKAISNISLDLPTTAKNPISVRLSDGKEFYKAIGSIASSMVGMVTFAKANNEVKPALVDDNGIVQTNLNGVDDSVGGFLGVVHEKHDSVYLDWTGSDLTGLTFKNQGTTVQSFNLSYDGSGNLISIEPV